MQGWKQAEIIHIKNKDVVDQGRNTTEVRRTCQMLDIFKGSKICSQM